MRRIIVFAFVMTAVVIAVLSSPTAKPADQSSVTNEYRRLREEAKRLKAACEADPSAENVERWQSNGETYMALLRSRPELTHHGKR